MPEDSHTRDPGKRFFEEFQPFASELIGKDGESREIPARVSEAGNEAGPHGIPAAIKTIGIVPVTLLTA